MRIPGFVSALYEARCAATLSGPSTAGVFPRSPNHPTNATTENLHDSGAGAKAISPKLRRQKREEILYASTREFVMSDLVSGRGANLYLYLLAMRSSHPALNLLLSN